jgi:hypothetical protein
LAGKRIFIDDQIVRCILQNIIGTGLKDGIPGKPIFLFCKQEENNYKFDIAVVQPPLFLKKPLKILLNFFIPPMTSSQAII